MRDDKVRTYERHHSMVMMLSANSYTNFCAFSGAAFGFSRYCERVFDIYAIKQCGQVPTRRVMACRTHFGYERLQRSEDILVVHLSADIISSVDA